MKKHSWSSLEFITLGRSFKGILFESVWFFLSSLKIGKNHYNQKYRDTRRHEHLRVGDICLLSYPGKVQETSRYCRVDKVYPDEDMVVRNVRISLRSRDAREKTLLYKSKKPVEMDVGVRRLVLICPSEDVPIGGDLSTPD